MIFFSYSLVYLPNAVITLIAFPTLLSHMYIDMVTACHFEGAFRIFEDLWFPFLVAAVVLRDRELGKGISPHAKSLWSRVSGARFEAREGSNVDRVRME